MAEETSELEGDDELVLALAAGASVREAAERAGVGERTVYRRLDDSDFRRRVSEARAAMFAQAVGKLASVTAKAAGKLERLLDADSDSVALGACRAVLELGPRLRESAEMEQRIAALERRDAEPTGDD